MKLKTIVLSLSLSLASSLSIADLREGPIEFRDLSGAVYRRSRFNGEMDLTRLAKTNCFEDMWLYVSGKWYDVGVNEGEATVDQNDEEINRVLAETNGPIYEYHTHPHDWCPSSDYPGISLEAISRKDVITHAVFSDMINRRGRRLFSRVADEHGIWGYSVTRDLRRRILNDEDVDVMSSSLWNGSANLLNIPYVRFYNRLNIYIGQQRRNGVIISYRKLR